MPPVRKAPQLGGIASAWLARLPGTDRRIPTPREAAIAWAELAGLCALALAKRSSTGPEALADVDTGAAELPLLVTGALLDFNHPPGSPVAVMLNGRVAATARAFAAHFATMLPDAMFRDGANTLEIYDLSG
jgi:hypothetical protein